MGFSSKQYGSVDSTGESHPAEPIKSKRNRRIDLDDPGAHHALKEETVKTETVKTSGEKASSPSQTQHHGAPHRKDPAQKERSSLSDVAQHDAVARFWEAWKLGKLTFDTPWKKVCCPQCGEGQQTHTLLAHQSGWFHCQQCGYHGDVQHMPINKGIPLRFSPSWWTSHTSQESTSQEHLDSWTPGAKRWFEQTGLQVETAQRAGVCVGQSYFPTLQTWHACLIFPCQTQLEQAPLDVLSLQIHGQPQEGIIQRQPQAQALPWGWERHHEQQVIIVDHPLDALALMESGFDSVVCVPDRLDPRLPQGQQQWDFLQVLEEDIKEVQRFVLAFRDDDRGHATEEEFARRVGKERCYRTRWQFFSSSEHSIFSALDLFQHQGAQSLMESISQATPFPVAGVYELVDVEERFEVLYEFGLQSGALTGWPSLDSCYTVKPGQWTLVTGIPGHGKSSWLDALLVNLAEMQDWRFALFSPENQPIERHFASLMEKKIRKPFNHGPNPRLSEEMKNIHKPWINDHFKIILPQDDQEHWSIDGVLNLAKVLVYRYGIKGLVIDPWNELDHGRASGISETDHISASLTKIRRFAREFDVHIWVAAHPAKMNRSADGKYPVPTMYDISGSAHWRNKADNGITIYRNVGEEDDDICDVHVQKIRFKEIGQVGLVSLRCDRSCGIYHDDLDQNGRARALQQGKTITSAQIQVSKRTYGQTHHADGVDHSGFTDLFGHDDGSFMPFDTP